VIDGDKLEQIQRHDSDKLCAPVPRGGSVCEPSEHDDFESALLAYSMKVFGASSTASDLQVDWSSDGLGFINPGDAVPSA